MNPEQTDELTELLAKATPGNLLTAESVTDEVIECPVCQGEGEVDARDYCNFDHKALGVQFYGIGDEFLAHERLWSAVMNVLPTLLDQHDAAAARIAALEERVAELETKLVAEREENLWRAYNIGHARGGRWTHNFMSDGEWLAQQCGFDLCDADYPDEAIRAAIPKAARAALETTP